MSFSSSDSSSCESNYKNFKQITRERLLDEMLGSCKTGDSKATWKVLIVDELTLKTINYACKMSDITEKGVSLVEDINKPRQPFPDTDAIYFIQPSQENVMMLLSDMSTRAPLYVEPKRKRRTLFFKKAFKHEIKSDMPADTSGRAPLYRRAFVFFSSSISKEMVSHIKNDSTVLTRIAALKEMNLEYLPIDGQGFVTNNGNALEVVYGDNARQKLGDACLNEMAGRIATVFASLMEFPFVRYQADKSVDDATTATSFRDLIPTKLAAGVWDCLLKYQKTIPSFPQTETCHLLILDRSVDPIAPIIHEWTYDAMCHDLLDMDANQNVVLGDHDPVWLQLRHAHIAHASEKLHEKTANLISKNKAALLLFGSRDHGGEVSTRDLQKMVQALPQYREQIDKLSLHAGMAEEVHRNIRELGLAKIGQLEQDLVFGDAGVEDVITYLNNTKNVHNSKSRENKLNLRLLMIVAAIYPEIFEGEEGLNLMELAGLTPDDKKAVINMRLLGGLGSSVDTKSSSKGTSFSSIKNADMHELIVHIRCLLTTSQKKRAARKQLHPSPTEEEEEETWQLSRFYPVIEEVIEKLSKGELSKEDYPCLNVNDPSTSSSPASFNPVAHPIKSRRRPTWARQKSDDDGSSTSRKKMGQRIFIVIVGGATRSELRVCHKLTAKLKREVVLGSSSLDDPHHFIKKLKTLRPST